MKTIPQLEQELEAAKTNYANTLGHEKHALVTHYKEAKVMAARAVAQIQVQFNNLHNGTYVGLRDIDITYLCKAKCMAEILEAGGRTPSPARQGGSRISGSRPRR